MADYMLKADGSVMVFDRMVMPHNVMLLELTGAVGFYWPASDSSHYWFKFLRGADAIRGGTAIAKAYVPEPVLLAHLLVN